MSELLTLDEALEELSSAEDFLNYFEVEYDASVVHVNRLHILQRFHDYLSKQTMPEMEEVRYGLYREKLRQAYQDFVHSDAQTEKVFKVFKMNEPQVQFVPLTNISLNKKDAAPI